MKSGKKLISIIFAAALLSGCATNYTNVRTFADAATSITQSTPALLVDNKLSCIRSQQLTDQVLTVVKAKDQTSFSADYKKICSQRDEKIKPISELNVVLGNFSGAVASLAKDDFVTGKTEAESATKFLASAGGISHLELTGEQVSAIVKIGQFVTNAMLNSKRQKALSEAFSGEMQANLKLLISALENASDFYLLDLDVEIRTINGVGQEMDLKKKSVESLALSEFQLKLEAQREVVNLRKLAIVKYKDSLHKFQEAIAPAADSIQNPSNKEILQQIKDFSQQAYELNKQFKAAFNK